MSSVACCSSRPSTNLSYNGVASLIRGGRAGGAALPEEAGGAAPLEEQEEAGGAALPEEAERARERAGRAALLVERRRAFLGGSVGG